MSWEPEDIAAYKADRADTQRAPERHSRRKPRVNPGRKVLLDRLDTARKSLLREIEWNEDPNWSRFWGPRMLRWSCKKYAEALQACWDAGIDVKS